MALSYQALKTVIPAIIEAGNVPNIVGEAGIGKSALVADVAASMGAKLFTTVVSLSEKGDLAIPVPPLTEASFVQTTSYGRLADVQYGYAHTLIELIQYAQTHPQQPIIWFLDEFNRGSQAVQSELMNLVLQRQINTLTLPQQVKLILAANPDATMNGFDDHFYGVTAGDDAIKDRTTRLVMQVNLDDWLQWAKQINDQGQANIDRRVQNYLREYPDDLRPLHPDADLYPTPRAWTRVANNLRALDGLSKPVQQAVQFEVILGDLGETVGSRFHAWLNQTLTVPELYEELDSPLPASLQTRFTQLSVAQQQALLVTAGMTEDFPLSQSVNAARLQALIQLLPIDGQVAVSTTLSQQPKWLAALQAADQAASRQLLQLVLRRINVGD
ncbi:AAA family ATPase [Furfurilactobacillus curtus]|uniref:AAA family ATPase n=1 Tax=Furfurilactobacillus curtus TaxID=1746200 RepID=UPI0038B3EF19